ncbi:MAG: MarR family transcriptional regulator [Olsenella sp.]|jgi:DNA-binding MarR family transcriptional regulator|nr:MarR family transcriptional regulator [Olsenella sp.]
MEQEGRSLEDMHMLLYRAYHAQTNYLRPRMARLGLGPGQPKLLAYLAVHGTSTQHEMATFFEVDDAAISRMLDLLRQAGLVRTARGEDRRTKTVELTVTGHGALAAWDNVCDEEQDAMLASLSAEERKTLAGPPRAHPRQPRRRERPAAPADASSPQVRVPQGGAR